MKKTIENTARKVRIAVPFNHVDPLQQQLDKAKLGPKFEVLAVEDNPINIMLRYDIIHGDSGPDSITIDGKFEMLFNNKPAYRILHCIIREMVKNMKEFFSDNWTEEENWNRTIHGCQEV